MGYHTISVGIKQEPCTARGGENLTLLAEGGLLGRMFEIAQEQAEEDRRALMSAIRRRFNREMMMLQRKARAYFSAHFAVRQVLRHTIGHVARVVRPVVRVFTASSAEAASRHRESDDSGGDDPDDDLPRCPRAASIIRAIRTVTGFAHSPIEQHVRRLGGLR